MNRPSQAALRGNRIFWLDNLRTFMIFCVVLLHAGIVYDSSMAGALFWIVDDPSTNSVSGNINLILDIFVMATIFFISGYFSPLSLENKGAWFFVKSKFKRLMVPWIIAVVTLMPLFKFIFLYSRNLPQENWTTYFHFSNGIFSTSWLWFLPVLFLFDVFYLIISKVPLNMFTLTLKKVIYFAFFLGFLNLVCIDIFNAAGWTKTIWINFQNERLLIYFLIFLLGSLCFKLKVFSSDKKNKKPNMIVFCTVWIPVFFYVRFFMFASANPGRFVVTEFIDALLLRFSFLLSLACILYLLINTFRFYLNRQGRILTAVNRNSYGVYIIHVIVLGGISLGMLNMAIPSIVKYFVLTGTTFVACNLIVSFYRKSKDSIKLKQRGGIDNG